MRAVVLLVGGVLVGGVAALTHATTVGLLLGLVASGAAAWALPGGWTLRFAFTAGWALVLGYVLVPRPGGGYLIAADARGYTLLGFGLVMVVVGIVTVRPLRPAARPSGPSGRGEAPPTPRLTR